MIVFLSGFDSRTMLNQSISTGYNGFMNTVLYLTKENKWYFEGRNNR